jgi:non-ribosomal peptide synthetase component F
MNLEASSAQFAIEAELVTELEHLARTIDVPLSTVLSAGLQAVLSHHGRTNDVVFGVMIVNRPVAELWNTVGNTPNGVAVRVDLGGTPTPRQLIARVHERMLEALDHGALPFWDLARALVPEPDPGHAPVCQVVINFTPALDATAELGDARLRRIERPPVETKHIARDLIWIVPLALDGRVVRIEYRRELFDRDTIGRLFAGFEQTLRAFVTAPDRPLAIELPPL